MCVRSSYQIFAPFEAYLEKTWVPECYDMWRHLYHMWRDAETCIFTC